jgi:hypothetical protein
MLSQAEANDAYSPQRLVLGHSSAKMQATVIGHKLVLDQLSALNFAKNIAKTQKEAKAENDVAKNGAKTQKEAKAENDVVNTVDQIDTVEGTSESKVPQIDLAVVKEVKQKTAILDTIVENGIESPSKMGTNTSRSVEDDMLAKSAAAQAEDRTISATAVATQKDVVKPSSPRKKANASSRTSYMEGCMPCMEACTPPFLYSLITKRVKML